jgi:hydrogenase nickel incorporation protein HypA/HybF
MHEAGIIESMLALAATRAAQEGATVIRRIHLRVGALRSVVPEALEHAFAVLREGTPAREARLEVDYVPAAFWCAGCRTEFETPELFGECPLCGTPVNDARRGMELEFVSMEVD